MATITGKTAVVMAKQLAGDIKTGDKVVITDDLYTISDINALYVASGLKIKLEKTAAATQFVESAANLTTVLERVEKYTGPVTANNTVAASVINDIAELTSGVVTATISPANVDSTLLVDLSNIKATDKISFTANATASDANDIVALKKIIPAANLSAITVITGGNTSADVAALKSASALIKTAAVTVTGEISAADANAIAKNSSAVTADVKAASAASLNSALKDLSAADALSLTVSGKSATAADLKALVTKIGAGTSTVDVNGIETITGNATDVKAVLAHIKFAPTGTPEIKVSGTISVVDANTIAASGKAGDVTATVAAGTAASLNGALGAALTGDDKLSLTVINNFDGSATDATHLVALAGKTASKITVNAKAITGTETDVLDIFVTNKNNFTGLGNKDVEVTGGAVSDVYNLNAILNATSGVVTASVTGNIAVLNAGLTGAKGTDQLDITVNDAVVNAADLKALDAKTSEAIDATAATNLTGSAADIKAVLKSTGINLNLTAVNIAPTGTISAADANAFSDATTGAVTATVTAGSATALNKALKDVPATGKDALTLTVTGATAAVSDLNSLDSKTSVDIDASAVKTVTGSLTDLITFDTNSANFVLNASLNATVNGVLTVADSTNLQTLLTSVPGKVTATVASLTADALVNALNATGTTTDALTLNVVEDVIVATGAITATDAGDLVVLDNQTSVKVKVDATQITGTYDKLEHVYVSGKAGFSNLGNETVTITGTTTAARVDSILKATTGAVTAAAGVIGAETAANLVSSLKNAKNDALALEITSGSVANAADLKALDAKTTTIIDADSIAKLIGTAADVKTVLAATTGINLGIAKDIDVSGTISAADANTIALNANAGVVTATVKADTAAKLNDALGALGGLDKLSLTVTGTSADAADLNGLNGKTFVDVNAAAIKTVTGTDTSIAALYAAGAAQVSGLGNEAVSVTGEASAADITSINTATTGLINVASVNTALTADGTFALSTGLGNLSEITGLYNLSADDGFNTNITFSIADLLAANDSSKSFDFSIVGDGAANTDTVTITNTSGWTVANGAINLSQYVFTKGSQTITINLTDIDAATVI